MYLFLLFYYFCNGYMPMICIYIYISIMLFYVSYLCILFLFCLIQIHNIINNTCLNSFIEFLLNFSCINITTVIITRFPSFFPATAHTLKYERSEELGKNLALGGIYRLPKFLKISKQNKFPQKNYRYNIIP